MPYTTMLSAFPEKYLSFLSKTVPVINRPDMGPACWIQKGVVGTITNHYKPKAAANTQFQSMAAVRERKLIYQIFWFCFFFKDKPDIWVFIWNTVQYWFKVHQTNKTGLVMEIGVPTISLPPFGTLSTFSEISSPEIWVIYVCNKDWNAYVNLIQ